jgi:hypothetical protein
MISLAARNLVRRDLGEDALPRIGLRGEHQHVSHAAARELGIPTNAHDPRLSCLLVLSVPSVFSRV